MNMACSSMRKESCLELEGKGHVHNTAMQLSEDITFPNGTQECISYKPKITWPLQHCQILSSDYNACSQGPKSVQTASCLQLQICNKSVILWLEIRDKNRNSAFS